MIDDALPPGLIPLAALHERDVEIRNPTAGAAQAEALDEHTLRYALVFETAERARAAGFELSDVARFYNRYFWFKRFVQASTRERGYDAGLEQQAFQMLETAPPDLDWRVLEAIERALAA